MKPLLLLSVSLCLAAAKQWVDPHSMDSSHKSKLPEPHSGEHPACVTAPKTKCTSDIHMRRIVRIILNNAYLDEHLGEGYIHIKLSPEEHQLLVNFSQNTNDKGDFHEVSTIFEKAFERPPIDRYQEMVLSLQERLYHVFFNQTSGALLGTAVSLFITYRLVKAHFTWKSIIQYLFFFFYIADFFITYFNIAREEEVESMVTVKQLGTAPPECDPNKMSWWSFIKTQITADPCKAYYMATYPNSVFVVAPSKVLTRQFKTLIVGPFGDVGEAFGKFGRGMFTSLPWGLNVVLFPVMLITACCLVFMAFLFITEPNFKLSLFHLFSIELGNPRVERMAIKGSRRPEQKKKRREVGGREHERAFLEDVPINSDGSSKEERRRTSKNPEKVKSKEKKEAE